MVADPQKLVVDHAPRLHRRRSSSPRRFFGFCWARSFASCLHRRVRSRGSRLVYSSRSHLPRFGGIVLGAQQKLMSTVFSSREKLRVFVLPPRSAQLSSGMECIRAAEDPCGRTLDSFPVHWDERCRSSSFFSLHPLDSWP